MQIIKLSIFLLIPNFFYTTKCYSQNFKILKLENHRIYNSNHSLDTIKLPFWEDFSGSNEINNTRWSEYENVLIKDYYNSNSPSINVIEFNGIDNNGTPYFHSNGYGESDVITSDIITLEEYKTDNSLYFSFFWNFNINGEYPDYEDTLKLQFYSNSDIWETVWFMNGGNENFPGNKFTFEIINIEEKFLHKNFKFKFFNQGNTEGPFDSWVIDYIYINSNRDSNDSTFLDRSLTYKGKKIFDHYISIPIKHFDMSDGIIDSLNMEINNFDNNIQPINYSFRVKSNELGIDLYIEEKTQLSPILNSFERRTINSKPFVISNYESDKDTVNLDLLFFIESGDTIFHNNNYKLNDSSRSRIKFSNYYSYDDGEAEYAAGLNQKNSEVVVKFETLKEDTLTHILILFPESTNENYSGNIELVAYDHLNDGNNKIISQNASINYNDKVFNLYEIKTPIIVKDSFFIGFKQFENNFLAVGLDKNNNTSEKIYYLTDGNWKKNDVIKGSLMIRPVFGESNYIITNNNREVFDEIITIFPNPSNGKYFINKKIDFIQIIDESGKIVKSFNNVNYFDISSNKKGMYLARIVHENKYYFKKILLK